MVNGSPLPNCSNYFTRVNADVACHQMGFQAGYIVQLPTERSRSLLNTDPRNGTVVARAIWLAGVDCYGDEDTISDCTRNAWGHYGMECSHDTDVVLRCVNFQEGAHRRP